MHQDRPHHGLDLSILSGAVLIPKPILRINTVRDRRAAHCGQYRQAAEVGAAASANGHDLIEDQLLNVIRACGTK